MRRLWTNGNIASMDPYMRTYEALGAEDGKIVFLGTAAEAAAQTWDEITDLGGKLMLPGFMDTHMHMLHYALFKRNLPLYGVKSIGDMVELGRARVAAEHPPYLLGMGWNQETLAENRLVTRDDMDRISTDIPVCMLRVCGHVAACNSKMLEIISGLRDLDPETLSHVDFIHGILREDAMRLYMNVIPRMDAAFVRSLIDQGQADLNACGITCVHSDDLKVIPGMDPYDLISLFRTVEREGGLTVRVYEQCLVDQSAFAPMHGCRDSLDNHESLFRTGPRKLLQDGSLGAKSALMIHGYYDEPLNHGIPIYTPGELYRWIKAAHDDHMNVAVHAIGDMAISQVCDAVERVQAENPWPEARHGVVHAQITNPELLRRMERLRLQAYIQPVFIEADMNVIEERVGPTYMKGTYNWKTMLELGIPCSGGSDCPVESFSILENLYAAVTRKNRAGTKTFLPEQALSMEEGVRLFTTSAAWASYDEDWRGSLELGKLADLAVLDRDIFHMDPDELLHTRVTETVLNGATVYRA